MIKSLKVVNLNRFGPFDLRFHDDINIVTGKNGSGKTTLVKLLWYAISSNLERIVPEIAFDSFELITDDFYVSMSIIKESNRHRVVLNYSRSNQETKECSRPLNRTLRNWEELEEANRLISQCGASVLFPTFRRIEGGLSIPNVAREAFIQHSSRIRRIDAEIGVPRDLKILQYSVNRLSENLSVSSRHFVASISTQYIV